MENGNAPHIVTSKGFMGDKAYSAWLGEIKSRYLRSQTKLAVRINVAMLEFYWQLGQDLVAMRAEQRWGTGVVRQLSLDLKAAFPGVTGFSEKNLRNTRQWYSFYCSGQKPEEWTHFVSMLDGEQFGTSLVPNDGMPRLFAAVPWRHHVEIVSHCNTLEEAVFYLKHTVNDGWSRKELTDAIDEQLYEKQGKAQTNFRRQLPNAQAALAQEILKDPYNFDFLSLPRGYDEQTLEQALANDITRFLLELGNGFAFVGRQVELVVDGASYRMDMLFYHIRLRCYVVVELKVVEFIPEFAGKLNFYVNAVNKLLRQPDDNPTIGLLICKSKSQTKVEWAFEGIQTPIGVATYENIRYKELLPSIEDLQNRIYMLEAELQQKGNNQ